MNYYNEHDPKIAAWLRELIRCGHIAHGVVDERNIQEVKADELKDYRQCHFFAGIGGWPFALRLAGVGDDEEVWTGSCPCQPFSQAGKGLGIDDERHLWPDFRNLIGQHRPAIVFGEQVAGAAGRLWLAGVSADLEAAGYRFAAANLCAAGVSAPHRRQRLYWVADDDSGRRARKNISIRQSRQNQTAPITQRPSEISNGLVYTNAARREELDLACLAARQEPSAGSDSGDGLVNADGYHGHWWSGPLQMGWNSLEGEIEKGGRKYRAQWRVKPEISSLVDGFPGFLDRLPEVDKRRLMGYINMRAAETKTRPGEILPLLQDADYAQKIWNTAGGSEYIPAQKILLSFLCEYRTGKAESVQAGAEKGCVSRSRTQGGRFSEEQMRSLWATGDGVKIKADGIANSSCGRRLQKQFAKKSASALCFMSLILAQAAQMAWHFHFQENASSTSLLVQKGDQWKISRVAQLRGFGNAIVPQIAAEFIQAYYEAVNTL